MEPRFFPPGDADDGHDGREYCRDRPPQPRAAPHAGQGAGADPAIHDLKHDPPASGWADYGGRQGLAEDLR